MLRLRHQALYLILEKRHLFLEEFLLRDEAFEVIHAVQLLYGVAHFNHHVLRRLREVIRLCHHLRAHILLGDAHFLPQIQRLIRQ